MDKEYNKCIIAIDKITDRIVLLKDLTNNISEGKAGITWKELINDCDFEYHKEFSNLESGIYKIEFTAWGWEEHTEAGSDGDSESKIISIKKIQFDLGEENGQ
jgi:hypothetical protein